MRYIYCDHCGAGTNVGNLDVPIIRDEADRLALLYAMQENASLCSCLGTLGSFMVKHLGHKCRLMNKDEKGDSNE